MTYTDDDYSTPRGETCLTINGDTHKLCLTLGALAEIEAAIGEGSLQLLQDKLANPSLGDVLVILHALLRGGGSALTLEALKMSDVDIPRAVRAIAGAFEALTSSESSVS